MVEAGSGLPTLAVETSGFGAEGVRTRSTGIGVGSASWETDAALKIVPGAKKSTIEFSMDHSLRTQYKFIEHLKIVAERTWRPLASFVLFNGIRQDVDQDRFLILKQNEGTE